MATKLHCHTPNIYRAKPPIPHKQSVIWIANPP